MTFAEALPNLRPLSAPPFVRPERRPPHCVYRSAALSHYGAPQIEHIRDRLGVRVHVDLRSEAERGRDAERANGGAHRLERVIHIPITTHATPPGAEPTGTDYVEYYTEMLGNAAAFARAFVVVGEHIERGVLFSCSQGKDRAGLLAAALLEAAGCSREAILADYARSMPAIARSTIVGPRDWEALGLECDVYLRRFGLGDAPLRLLLERLDRQGTSLVRRFRSHAPDGAVFDAVAARLAAPGNGIQAASRRDRTDGNL